MTLRADTLRNFGLPDVEVFNLEPAKEPGTSIQRIKIGWEGGNPELWAIGAVMKLAVAIRNIDPALADQLNACVERARGEAGNRN